MTGDVTLLDGHSRETEWPRSSEPFHKYVRRLVLEGTNSFAANINAKAAALCFNGTLLPVILTTRDRRQAHVCSPISHYIEYPRGELSKMDDRLRPALFRAALRAAGTLCRACDLDQVVYVNNWLLSTNPPPKLAPDALEAITGRLVEMFPDRAIVFRSVNPRLEPEFFDALKSNGYTPVASRQVYLMDFSDRRGMKNHNVRRDLRLLSTSGYRLIDASAICDADIPRLKELYQALYIRKHSPLNQQFTNRFFELLIRERLMEIVALRKDRRIDAFVGFYRKPGVLTGGIIGYDTSLPASLGLFRQAMVLMMRAANLRGDVLNISGGARSFKMLRGAQPCLEYDAVFAAHLPYRRRLGWRLAQQAGRFYDVTARAKRSRA